jgi:hypothetical protein
MEMENVFECADGDADRVGVLEMWVGVEGDWRGISGGESGLERRDSGEDFESK